ncbi:MAG TPA: type 1 glutamine amidotransferase domain-containing protein [Acidimicrobiales bacterium]|jgi:protease I|nr:type 1 glutamine amidotransferase domain-containing protein [Acidimicrobiales bacterium]
MANELQGKRIAFLVANEGVEQVELTTPWQAVEKAGGRPELIAPKPGKTQAMNHLDKADSFPVDRTTEEARADEYDGVVLPGGVANPDQLRMDRPAVNFIREMLESGKPAAVICHGPWTLVEADVVRGRTLTSWPSLQTDIRNAGGTWVDQEVQVCECAPGTLVTSRKPDDLPAFCSKMIEVFQQVRQPSGSRA